MLYIYTIFSIKNYNNALVVFLFQFYLILFNFSENFYNLNYYYQIVNHLNTKNNITYLGIFVLLLLKNKKKKTDKIFFIIIFSYCCNFNYLFFDINQIFLNFNLSKQSINTNLLNGIMLIHPPILYFFYMYFLYAIYVNIYIVGFKKYKIHNSKAYSYHQSIIIYTSIILGCL